MTPADLTGILADAARAQGLVPAELVPGPARRRRGEAVIGINWLRPEPVRLRGDAARGVLLLDEYLPFVQPGGRLHRRVKARLAETRPGVLCRSRGGHLTIGLPAAGDWPAALAALLAAARDIHAMLQAEWPDYAHGVFAPP